MLNIFEHPWGLLIAAAVALAVVLIVRAAVPQKKRWWQWLLPVVLAGGAFGLDFLVQTDLEKINAVITKAVKAFEQEDCVSIGEVISNSYRDSHHKTKQMLISHCESMLGSPFVEKAVSTIVSVDISSATATAIFTVRIVFDKQSFVYQNFKRIMLTKLQMNLHKQQDNQWFITCAELVEIDMQPVNWEKIREF